MKALSLEEARTKLAAMPDADRIYVGNNGAGTVSVFDFVVFNAD